MHIHEDREIGDVCGMVIQNGVLMYKIFNGYHHDSACYWYHPVNASKEGLHTCEE